MSKQAEVLGLLPTRLEAHEQVLITFKQTQEQVLNHQQSMGIIIDLTAVAITTGKPVSPQGLERCIVYHQQGIAVCEKAGFWPVVKQHERCLHFLQQALNAHECSKPVTRDLCFGFYLNQGKSWPALTGVSELTSEQYHYATSGMHDRQVMMLASYD